MTDRNVSVHIPDQAVFLLKGEIQHYAWGGSDYLPELLDVSNPDQKPFAELWMGAHKKAPSSLVLDNQSISLEEVIAQNPIQVLGEEVSQKFQKRLPFLFKVLDVKDMLSIQVHPTKREAEKGFKKENEAGIPLTAKHRNYRDDNHKPEIMVALTEFWLLHGFRKEEEIEEILDQVPEFKELKGQWSEGKYFQLYKYIMELPQEEVNRILSPLAERLIPAYKKDELAKDTPDFWAARAIVNSVLPEGDYDRGIFSVYLFNLVHANPGEGIFQDAGIPHAYLEGVNVELMANSDNVLRGGLTPKHIDVPELLKHVVFEAVEPHILKGESLSPEESVYKSPAPDFELSQIVIHTGKDYQKDDPHSVEIVIVMDGNVNVKSKHNSLSLGKGEIFLVPALVSYSISASENSTLYKATVPIF